VKATRRIAYGLAAAISLGLLSLSALVLLAAHRDSRALAQLLPPPPRIEVDGLRLRDLDRNGRIDPYEDPRTPIAQRVADLLSRMSRAEKVSLLLAPPLEMEPDGRPVDGWAGAFTQGFGTAEAVIERQLRHFTLINPAGCRDIATWSNRLQKWAERTRLGIPVTVAAAPRNRSAIRPERSLDGFASWPTPLGIAASRDPSVARRLGEATGRQFRAAGLHVVLAPDANVLGRSGSVEASETFGEDPEIAAQMVRAYLEGLRGRRGTTPFVLARTRYGGRLAPCPLETETAADGSSCATRALEAAIDAASPQLDLAALLTDDPGDTVLRPDTPAVLSSPPGSFATRRIGPIDLNSSGNGRFARGIEAGIEQFVGATQPDILIELLRAGAIAEQDLNGAVARVLGQTFELGLFDEPLVDPARAATICADEEIREEAREAQRRAVVLLQNDPGPDGRPLLPLQSRLRIYTEGLDPSVVAEYATVVSSLDEADVAIVEIQTASVVPPSVPEHMGPLLQTARRKPTVAVFALQGPVDLSGVRTEATSVVVQFGAGDQALLDVLFGRARPRGRLPLSLPGQGGGFPIGHGLDYDRRGGPT
jgi:beta-glucosidase